MGDTPLPAPTLETINVAAAEEKVPRRVVVVAPKANITSLAAMAALNHAYGISTGSPNGLVVSFEPGVPLASSSASVPWSEGAYGLQATYEGVIPPAVPGTLSWWTLGQAGLVRFDQTFTAPDTEIQGLGQMTTDPGGRAGILLGSSAAAEMQLSFADLAGEARVVESGEGMPRGGLGQLGRRGQNRSGI